MAAGDGSIIVEYDLKKLKVVQRMIREIERRGSKVDKPLKRWGVYMLRENDKTFIRGRRGPIVWPALKASTIRGRTLRKRGASRGNPRRILQDTGGYKKSFRTVTFTQRSVRAQSVFSKHPLAEIHHKGATIPKRKIRAKPGKVLRWSDASGVIRFARSVEIPETKIPARPSAFLLPSNIRKAMNLIGDHLQEVSK